MIEFACGCGATITVEDDGPDHEVDGHAYCNACGSMYAVTLSLIEQGEGSNAG